MLKYSHKRFDIAPIRNDHQQTYRHVIPQLSLWSDGTKYNMVGFQIGWWKWSIIFFFKTEQIDAGLCS